MYKIKIEDLETGKVQVDTESDCILAVINLQNDNATENLFASLVPADVIINVATTAVKLSDKTVRSITAKLFGGDNHE